MCKETCSIKQTKNIDLSVYLPKVLWKTRVHAHNFIFKMSDIFFSKSALGVFTILICTLWLYQCVQVWTLCLCRNTAELILAADSLFRALVLVREYAGKEQWKGKERKKPSGINVT